MNGLLARYLPEFAFIAVLLSIVCGYLAWESERERNRMKNRLKIGRLSPGPSLKSETLRLLRKVWKYIAPRKEKEIRRIRQELSFAGYRDPAALYYYTGFRGGASLSCALGAGAWFFLTGAFQPLHIPVVILFVVLGGDLPHRYLRYRVRKRHLAIFRELPDTLDMLMVCLEAGLGFEMALFRVSRELEVLAPVLSREFALYFFETRGGISRQQGLINVKERNGSDPLRGVVDVILQSLRFGTDIISALEVHANGMRNKRQQLAEEKAAKIAPKLVLPLIGLILPALLIIVLAPAVLNLSRHFLE